MMKESQRRKRKTTAPPKNKKRWVSRVKTNSTYPPSRTFTGSAEKIARTMARKDVSPKGPGSGIRLIQYYINRAGRNLPVNRRRELEKARRILSQKGSKGKKSWIKETKQSPSRILS
jgi:hypothetical protein